MQNVLYPPTYLCTAIEQHRRSPAQNDPFHCPDHFQNNEVISMTETMRIIAGNSAWMLVSASLVWLTTPALAVVSII